MANDRYSRLLGLPPDPRPPTCYLLLGLGELTDDPNAVRRGADEQLAKLNRLVGSADNDDALALMAEIGEAIRTLTDPERKAAYDKPLFDVRWREFTRHRHQVMPGGHALTEAGRLEWVEMGIERNLPWREVYRHIDKVAAQAEQGGDTMRPAARLPNVSLEEATLIFRCLSLGLELASEKSPDAYQRLAAAGQRLGLPEGAQVQISREAGRLGPAGWHLPLAAGAVASDREKAVAFVVRGMSFARLLSPEDDRRLEEIAIRSGLSPEVAREIIDREIGHTHSIRMGELAREVATIGSGAPAAPVSGDPWQRGEADSRLRRRRRVIVGTVIALVLAVAAGLIITQMRGPAADEAPDGEPVQLTPGQRAQRDRRRVLNLIGEPRAARLARRAMGGTAVAEDRLAAVTELGAMADTFGAIEAVGWVAVNDLHDEVRLAAVDVLADADVPDAWRVLVQLTDPATPQAIAARAADVLTGRRDTYAARLLMGRLASPDQAVAAGAAVVLKRMTEIELVHGMPTTEDEYLEYADLVRRWIDAEGPPAGEIEQAIPTVDAILLLPNTETDRRRERLELRLVHLAAEGNADAWQRVITLASEEPSEAIRSALAEALLPIRQGESFLAQMLLLGRVDARRTTALAANLSAAAGHQSGVSDVGRGIMAAVFHGNVYRRWLRSTYPELAERYPGRLAPQTEQQQYERAVMLLAALESAERDAEVEVVAAEARRGNLAAASVLRFLLRLGPGDAARRVAAEVVAAQGTRQAWFLLVDELPRHERLSPEVEKALSSGFRTHVPTWTAYGETRVERFLARQFLVRHGLKHLDRLPDKPYLRARGLPSANLPVITPTQPPATVALAAAKAFRSLARLDPAQRKAIEERLAAYIASGDAVAEQLQTFLRPGK
jgi:hypothetical protein